MFKKKVNTVLVAVKSFKHDKAKFVPMYDIGMNWGRKSNVKNEIIFGTLQGQDTFEVIDFKRIQNLGEDLAKYDFYLEADVVEFVGDLLLARMEKRFKCLNSRDFYITDIISDENIVKKFKGKIENVVYESNTYKVMLANGKIIRIVDDKIISNFTEFDTEINLEQYLLYKNSPIGYLPIYGNIAAKINKYITLR